MAADYIEKAVASVADYLSTNLPAELRQVETDQGLLSGALENPAQVLAYKAVEDTTSPAIQVYCTSGRQVNPNSGLFVFDIDAIFMLTHNANMGEGATKARRYATAILRCIGKAPTLGSTVSGAFVTDLDPLILQGPDSNLRHLYGFGLEVTIHSPLTC